MALATYPEALGEQPCLLLGLAPGEVYLAGIVTYSAGGLLHHRFTLTLAGGLLSVALSLGLPRVGVTHHLALWSPDVPRLCRDRLADPSPTSLVSDQVLARVENEDLCEVQVEKAIDAYATRRRIQVEVGILCAIECGRRKCSGWHHVSGYRHRLTAIFLDDFL